LAPFDHDDVKEYTNAMPSLIELVIAEALSRDLRIERLASQSKRHPFDKRLLLIEGRRCQVIPSRRGHPSAEYPDAEYFPLYLPRTDWPDFLIYVSLIENHPVFRIVPRVEMSKDTGLAPESLERYRDALELLQQNLPPLSKKFKILSWQLQAVKTSAKKAGLEVEFIKTKKTEDGRRWPPVIKRRVLIAGKKCAIFSAARISQDPEKHGYNYAVFKVSNEDWPEYQLHIVKSVGSACDVFVIPRKHIAATTSASLDHPELARYKNAWALLTTTPEFLEAIRPIAWKEPTPPMTPTKHFLVLQETIRMAESRGLSTEPTQGEVTSHRGVQSFLYVSKKRCQVIQANVMTDPKRAKTFRFVSLQPPASEWAEILIVYSALSNAGDAARFYIIPRKALTKPTARSVQSKWLKQYEEAWHLLLEA
jgi:hypothetical protein